MDFSIFRDPQPQSNFFRPPISRTSTPPWFNLHICKTTVLLENGMGWLTKAPHKIINIFYTTKLPNSQLLQLVSIVVNGQLATSKHSL